MTLAHLLLLLPFIFAGALGIVTIQRALSTMLRSSFGDRAPTQKRFGHGWQPESAPRARLRSAG